MGVGRGDGRDSDSPPSVGEIAVLIGGNAHGYPNMRPVETYPCYERILPWGTHRMPSQPPSSKPQNLPHAKRREPQRGESQARSISKQNPVRGWAQGKTLSTPSNPPQSPLPQAPPQEKVTNEQQLFRDALKDVTPLDHRHQIEVRPPPPSPRPRFREADDQAVLRELLDSNEPADVEDGETLIYAQEGVSQEVLRRLRRGHFHRHDHIDLHGLTVEEARAALIVFLDRSQRERQSCVRVIHGKGNRSAHRGPILKRKVNDWLRRREEVLAFCSARPMDGGTGAIYVLLRRRQPQLP